MNFTTHQSQIRTLKQGDPRFHIQDKFTITARAAIKISRRCPENYQDLIQECIRHGWIEPVAYVTERELLFMGLSNEN